ncbi:uncharacterized protein EMH_0042260 [Eimeria mitis]|uniref:Uncharacterized protein n=1 Tax=Eimeria mitis TaxID=44415 RepID=U6JUZ6_9EIME|nr:uncharacterized protein EMH_0042260 [Eimeria mitis]CDJ28596.1 hypothetical protein EMH_0042260 [Eimeria mitis]
MNGGNPSALSGDDAAIFKSIPHTYQEKFVEIFKPSGSFPQKAASFPILNCLAAMVGDVLKHRKSAGSFNGSFAPICFDLTDQVRGSIPSAYDCSVGYTLGLMCGCLVTSPAMKQLPSAALMISNPSAAVASFSPLVVPLSAAAIACGLGVKGAGAAESSIGTVVASGAFDLQLHTPTQAAAAAALSSTVQKEFLLKDTYLNSGPLQFCAAAGAADADRVCNFLLSARK